MKMKPSVMLDYAMGVEPFLRSQLRKVKEARQQESIWKHLPALNLHLLLAAGIFRSTHTNGEVYYQVTKIADYLDETFEKSLRTAAARKFLPHRHITPQMVDQRLRMFEKNKAIIMDLEEAYEEAYQAERAAPKIASVKVAAPGKFTGRGVKDALLAPHKTAPQGKAPDPKATTVKRVGIALPEPVRGRARRVAPGGHHRR